MSQHDSGMVPIERIEARAYEIPTDRPEADGTLEWDSTILVVVELTAGGKRGLGYTYADAAAAHLINRTLAEELKGHDVMDVPARMVSLLTRVRNKGRPGMVAMALSAVDAALWDTKARLLDLPLVRLLGAARDWVPVYGSGGFTSYSIEMLKEQLAGWVEQGLTQVKMKVGRHPEADGGRVWAAREAIGPDTRLFVDANGAYMTKQALVMAESFAEAGVVWFEEPVSSDDLEGLRLLRQRIPSGMNVAAGEYGWDAPYFRRLLGAEAVDVVQADATRCLGVTGFLQVDALCEAFQVPLSGHGAPGLHLHVCCAARSVVHQEYFHDHVRIEHLLFDGARRPVKGALTPDLSRPGMGLEFKRQDAERYAL